MKWLTPLSALLLFACSSGENPARTFEVRDSYGQTSEQFAEYWYSGKAELAAYELTQGRYGEYHKGSSVLIFVTEPFSKDKQVKLDNPNSGEAVTVMKLNFTRKFQTGIYPYSMMLSAFTPVDDYNYPYTLKATTSSQEWCGHTFNQYNWNGTGYDLKGFSYFESEGDYYMEAKVDFLQDELWNRIRIDPDKLPVGEYIVAPGSFFRRLGHDTRVGLPASLNLEKGDVTSVYTIHYHENSRSLKITFDNEFPYLIRTWSEYKGEELLSSGELKNTLHTDYWRKNASEYEYLYDSLTSLE